MALKSVESRAEGGMGLLVFKKDDGYSQWLIEMHDEKKYEADDARLKRSISNTMTTEKCSGITHLLFGFLIFASDDGHC